MIDDDWRCDVDRRELYPHTARDWHALLGWSRDRCGSHLNKFQNFKSLISNKIYVAFREGLVNCPIWSTLYGRVLGPTLTEVTCLHNKNISLFEVLMEII
jgi:hypothetical protein